MVEAAPEPSAVDRRYRSLDGLRGIAALVVVVYHVLLSVPSVDRAQSGAAQASTFSVTWWLYRTPLRLLFAGHEAVLIFFVLSGFVLTLPLVNGRRMSWRSYYPRRLVRLYLPVWGALVLALALELAVPRHTHLANPFLGSLRAVTAHAFAKDALLLVGASDLDGPLWSLRWEVWFSLLLPVMFAVLLLLRVPRWWPGAIAVLVAASIASRFTTVADALPGSFLSDGLLQYMPVFAIGMIAALRRETLSSWARRLSSRAGSARLWAALAVIAALLTVSPSLITGRPQPFGPAGATGYALSLVGVMMLIFIAQWCAGAARFLDSRAVQWLGQRSFSLYLIHEPIVAAIALKVRPTGFLPWLWIALPTVAGVLLVAELFFRLVERPAHRLSRIVGVRAAGRTNQPRQPSGGRHVQTAARQAPSDR